jgi:hypothetical protein
MQVNVRVLPSTDSCCDPVGYQALRLEEMDRASRADEVGRRQPDRRIVRANIQKNITVAKKRIG